MPFSPLVLQADRAALAAARVVGGAWRDLLAILRSPAGFWEDYRRARAVLARLPGEVQAALRRGLARLYAAGHQQGAATVREALRVYRREQFAALLMPPPSADYVRSVLARFVRPADWQGLGQRGQTMPEDLAARFANLTSQGLTQRQVAAKIRPDLDGSRVRAARFARTFGIEVAHKAQADSWAGVDDLIVGYRLLSVRGPTTRPWHRERHGTIYWKRPGPGQKGLAQMPRPPLEPEDPAERPPGTPRIAWNCLCILQPVFREG